VKSTATGFKLLFFIFPTIRIVANRSSRSLALRRSVIEMMIVPEENFIVREKCSPGAGVAVCSSPLTVDRDLARRHVHHGKSNAVCAADFFI
jgi:hypothetical protein